MLSPLLLTISGTVTAIATPLCPAGMLDIGVTAPISGTNWTVCETTSVRAGYALFLHPTNGTVIRLNKSAVHMFVNESECYAGKCFRISEIF